MFFKTLLNKEVSEWGSESTKLTTEHDDPVWLSTGCRETKANLKTRLSSSSPSDFFITQQPSDSLLLTAPLKSTCVLHVTSAIRDCLKSEPESVWDTIFFLNCVLRSNRRQGLQRKRVRLLHSFTCDGKRWRCLTWCLDVSGQLTLCVWLLTFIFLPCAACWMCRGRDTQTVAHHP